MSTFLNDTATDTNGTTLASHVGETGATWTLHTSYSNTLEIQSNRVASTADGSTMYYASGSPSSAEYDIEAVIYKVSSGSGDRPGVGSRINTSANTSYMGRWNDVSAAWELYKIVSGSATLLGSYSDTLSVSSSKTLKLETRDAAKKIFVDGVERISSIDNAITAAGKAGIRHNRNAGGSNNGVSIDSITASDAVIAIPNGTLTLSSIAPSIRQVSVGKITEIPGPGFLSLAGIAPNKKLKHHEPIANGTLTINGVAPLSFVKYREQVPGSNLTITSFAPNQKLKHREKPTESSLRLSAIAPVTRQSGKIIKSIPSSQLRLVSFNPNIPPARAVQPIRAGGGPKKAPVKIAVIGNKRYRVSSYTEFRRLLEHYLKEQQKELQLTQAETPKSKRIITLKRNVTRAETRLVKAEIEYKRIQEENEAIILMALA